MSPRTPTRNDGTVRSVAVLGAGVSGLAVAALLRQQGREVTIFERAVIARPVGSGLVLHQSGLSALAHLDLERAAIDAGSKLTRFEGRTTDGKGVFDLSHERGEFSLGIHRHAIFSLLHEKVLALNIPVVSGCTIDDIDTRGSGLAVVSGTRRIGHFDLVIDASGAHSVIRDRHASIRSRREFAYGALWAVCEAPAGQDLHSLRQRFHGARVGIGVIPIGTKPGAEGRQFVALHWSIRNADYETWRRSPLERWQADATRLWDATDPLTSQITRHDDLAWARYADVALNRLYAGRIAFIGDAAHSISPRLGQGANLGLIDALTLSRALGGRADVGEALRDYDAQRRNHVRYYHAASRWLSLLFQSDSVVAPVARDLGFGLLCRSRYMRRQMLDSLGGLKTGLFGKLDLRELRAGA